MSVHRVLDVDDACAILGVPAGELADVCRREAGRRLRLAAELYETERDDAADFAVARAQQWQALAIRLEHEWGRVNVDDAIELGEGSNSAASGVTEATPRLHDAAASQGETIPKAGDDAVQE